MEENGNKPVTYVTFANLSELYRWPNLGHVRMQKGLDKVRGIVYFVGDDGQ